MFQLGHIIHGNKKEVGKRLKFKVINAEPAEGAHTITLSPVYLPGPKSQIKRKSIFSKVKHKIHN